MKKHILSYIFLIAFLPAISFAQTTHKIDVSNYVFTPSSLTGVKVGDIIEWDWVSGSHTVTSVTIPNGAASFAFSISSGNVKYTVTMAGTYDYQCDFHVGSGMTGSFVVSAATSVSSIVLNEITIEPNPAHDYVTIKTGTVLNSDAKLNVYDLLGRKVLSQEMKPGNEDASYTLDISCIKAGMYLVIISSGSSFSKPMRMIKK
jgi:plastocyanin